MNEQETIQINDNDQYTVWQDDDGEWCSCFSGTTSDGMYYEGEDLGPFNSKQEALDFMQIYIDTEEENAVQQELLDYAREMAGEQEKREIAAHKGGRTERVDLRLTPDELKMFDEQRGDLSRPDYLTWLLKQVFPNATITHYKEDKE